MPKRRNEAEPPPVAEKLIPGRWAIIAIAIVAIAMTAFSWGYWYLIGNDIKNRWGAENTVLIAQASEVDLYELDPVGDATNAPLSIMVGKELMPALRHKRLIAAESPGWTHIRPSLVRDAAYDFAGGKNCPPVWKYALRFREKDRQVILLISPECPYARLADGTREVLADGTIRADRALRKSDEAARPLALGPIAEGLALFLGERLPPADAESAQEESGQEN